MTEVEDFTITVPGVGMEKNKRQEEGPKEALWYCMKPVPLKVEGVKVCQPNYEPRGQLTQFVVGQVEFLQISYRHQEPRGQVLQIIVVQAELLELA